MLALWNLSTSYRCAAAETWTQSPLRASWRIRLGTSLRPSTGFVVQAAMAELCWEAVSARQTTGASSRRSGTGFSRPRNGPPAATCSAPSRWGTAPVPAAAPRRPPRIAPGCNAGAQRALKGTIRRAQASPAVTRKTTCGSLRGTRGSWRAWKARARQPCACTRSSARWRMSRTKPTSRTRCGSPLRRPIPGVSMCRQPTRPGSTIQPLLACSARASMLLVSALCAWRTLKLAAPSARWVALTASTWVAWTNGSLAVANALSANHAWDLEVTRKRL
mmetsp:Transcript_21087/g.52792  ORF Transcript_21087/g.52792 Transcript_21087/m.52792 type:complete len:276 (+) Transcript_21087:747-1574(+)